MKKSVGIHRTAIIGVFNDRRVAEDAVNRLIIAGFSPADLVMVGQQEADAAVTSGRFGLPEEAEAGQHRHDRTWGGAGGLLIGLLLGAEAAAFVGLSGPILLGSLAVATTLGAASGAIYGEGVADLDISEEATALREEIHAGHVLVVAYAQDQGVTALISEVMAAEGATNIHERTLR